MSDASLTTGTVARDAEFGDFVELLKPRVMRLVIFTAAVGMLVAPVAVHPVIAMASIICIAVGAGASGALNMWWDSDIDAVMKRTAKRPIPSGRITNDEALAFGLTLSVFSVGLLFLFGNALAAGLLAFTIFFYAVIYSMWLKRATPQNIVIGGAAGAFPPMIGWAVATGSVGWEPVLMFALIFFWTPPHFWALALFVNDDYKNADVPMLTVVAGTRTTRNHILAYALILAPLAVLLAFTQVGGLVYLAAALYLNTCFVLGAWRIWRRDDAEAEADEHRAEKRFFRFSIAYLFAHFVVLLIELGLRVLGWGMPNWPVIL
ncbi:MAG: heme o synthase [Pseudomonadota bacterium]